MTLRLGTGLANPAMLLRRLATLPALLVLLTGNVGLLATTAHPGAYASGITTWTTPVLVDTGTHLHPNAVDSISCPSTTLCVAVDSAGNVVGSTGPTGGASAWTTSEVDGRTPLDAISCP
jgi:hypothetical protein